MLLKISKYLRGGGDSSSVGTYKFILGSLWCLTKTSSLHNPHAWQQTLNALVNTPVNTQVNTLANTLVNTLVNTPVKTLVNTLVNTCCCMCEL